MRVIIVTGGRYYANFAKIDDVLSFLKPDLIVQGGANGADKLARDWGTINNVQIQTFIAEWDKYGRAAGPKRNERMLKENPDAVVVAFNGGAGTEGCIKIAIERGMDVLRVEE